MSIDSSDLEVLRAASEWLAAGQTITLVTVTATWGSAPRPVGSLLVVGEGGYVGSVSGGCVEFDLLERLAQSPPALLPQRLSYGVDKEEARRFGLPCGGQLDLLLEPLRPPARSLDPIPAGAEIDTLLTQLARRQLCRRRVWLADGRVELIEDDPAAPALTINNERLERRFGPQWLLLLIGAGEITRLLSSMAQALDYRVVICDPRREQPPSWCEGLELDRRMPDDAVALHLRDRRCALIALTHDPRLDDMALMEALHSPAFYVGALGSQRSSAARRERLASLDLTPDELARLHAPVGLPIGGKTPAEIALSILADLTATRHHRRLSLDLN